MKSITVGERNNNRDKYRSKFEFVDDRNELRISDPDIDGKDSFYIRAEDMDELMSWLQSQRGFGKNYSNEAPTDGGLTKKMFDDVISEVTGPGPARRGFCPEQACHKFRIVYTLTEPIEPCKVCMTRMEEGCPS